MKILQDNSILKRLPRQIERKQFLILDSLRFLIEIIEVNYNELVTELENISKQDNKNLPKVFNCIWNIIDNIQRLNNVYKKFPQKDEPSLFKEFEYIKAFRNSYQHLEDRIEEIIFDNELTLLGAIKWVVNDSNKPFTCLAIGGTYFGKSMIIHNPSDFHQIPFISNINLMTVTKISNHIINENELNISDLVDNLAKKLAVLENHLNQVFLEKKLQPDNLQSLQDIIIFFKND